MTPVESVGIWITAIATAVTAFTMVWNRRRSVAIPFYSVLKASKKDADPFHWVQINADLAIPVIDPRSQLPVSPSLPVGKVVRITTTTLT